MTSKGATRRRQSRFATMLLAAACALTSPAALAGGDAPSPVLVEWLDKEMARQGIPGVSIAVFTDYELRWAAGFGLADIATGRKVTADTLFQAASVSKAITGIATLIALDEHDLDVDDSVNAILERLSPEASVGAWQLPNPFDTPVTIRMLLSHTAGTNDFRYSGYRYGYDEDPPRPIEPLPTMRAELLGISPANTPAIRVIRQPGKTWAYSPAGFTVLQALLMNLYDRPFADVMDELVLDPLGLRQGSFAQPTPAGVTPDIAVPYIDGDTPLADGPRVFVASASGGMTTTPSELATIMIAMQKALAGETVGRITPEIARALVERQTGRTEPGKCLPTGDPDHPACDSSSGLGFDVNLSRYFLPSPDGMPTGDYFGHSGFNSGYLSVMFGRKTGGSGMALMLNVAPEDMSGTVPQIGFLLALVRRIADDEGL